MEILVRKASSVVVDEVINAKLFVNLEKRLRASVVVKILIDGLTVSMFQKLLMVQIIEEF